MNIDNKPITNILVAGGAGFIGSNFIKYLFGKYTTYKIINVDKLTYCGNLKNLEEIRDNPLYKFINGDICDSVFIEKIILEEKIDSVINFAAESDVDRSVKYGEDCIRTNINGVRTLLDIFKDKRIDRFIQISTDEVYGNIEFGSCKEDSRLNPTSTYSVSKAAADLLCLSYYKTYNMPIVILRPTNNYGLCQFPEKIVPKFITNLIQNKSVTLYGDGRYIRSWVYVEDTCSAIDIALHKSEPGQIYNISTNNPITNLDLTENILNIINKSKTMIKHVEDRPGHDRRYSVDSTKIRQLGWKPIHDFLESLKFTIHWYQNNPDWWQPILPKVKIK